MDDFDAYTRAELGRPSRGESAAVRRPRPGAPSGRRADLGNRPDRVAMWAFLMAIAITIAAAASAQAAV